MNARRMARTASLAGCLAATVCLGQEKQWDRRYGGSDHDVFSALVQYLPGRGGGFVIAGSSRSGISGDKTQASRGGYDFWALRISDTGNLAWDKRYGGSGDDKLFAILYATDIHLLIFCGASESPADGDKTRHGMGLSDYWTVDASGSTGNFSRDSVYGGGHDDVLVSAPLFIHTANRTSHAFLGYSESGIGGDKTQASRGGFDYWVVLYNPNTDSIHYTRTDKTFGGSGLDVATCMDRTADGGYILGGYSYSGISGDKSQASRGGADYWVIKIDRFGNKLWDKRFGGGQDDMCSVVRYTSDGGYILGGTSYSGISGDKSEASRGGADYWVVKIDSAGNKQWDKRFGGSADDELADLRQTSDGGYILGGSSASGANGDVSGALRGAKDYWIVKIDANGNKKWNRRFGGTGQDNLKTVQQTSDGGYILGGSSYSGVGGDKTEGSRGGQDYWLVKVAVSPPDAFESDDTKATAKAIGNQAIQTRSIHEEGDVDWAKFTIGTSNARNIVVETAGAEGNTEMWLFDATGTEIAYNDDISTVNRFSRITRPTLAKGTYYVKVQAKGNASLSIPAYTLRVGWTFPPDAFEPDNRKAKAKPIANGQTQRRSIHAPGNADWAKFVIPPGGASDLRIETSGSSGNTEIWLINGKTGAQMAYNDNISAANRFSRITRKSLGAGTYFIKIQSKGNTGVIAAYKLLTRWTPKSAAGASD